MKFKPPPVSLTMSVPPQVGGAVPLDRVVSPAIERLRRDLDRDHGALARFWDEAERSGTPLLDADDAPDRTIVTFLARGADDVADVFLVANKIADPATFDECRLERLAGTDVWWLALRTGSDWRASYGLAVVPTDAPVPHDDVNELRRSRALAAAPPDAADRLDRWFDAIAFTRPDPLARESLDERQSVVSLPDAPAQPWIAADRPAASCAVTLSPSPAAGITPRDVVVHVPPIEPDGRWPLLVLLDGDSWATLPIGPALDAATAAGAIPPLLAVMVPALDMPTRVADLTCNTAFVDFVVDRVVESVAERWPISDDPQRVIIAGQSLGGLTALYAACARPDRVANAVCQSGSFWWPNRGDAGGSEWLTGEITAATRPAGAVYVEVGTQEWVLIEPTRRLHAALRAAGADVTYREFNGGHDRACWRGGLFDGIAAVTRTWTPEPSRRTGDLPIRRDAR